MSANAATNAWEPASTESSGQELPVAVIERRSSWQVIDAGEVWRYRELLGFLVWRDLKVRYRQTVLGAGWALMQPLAQMLIFAVFLGRVVTPPRDGMPYSLYVLIGLVPWVFLANAITSATTSVVTNQNLITKVYFPRVLIPWSTVAAGLVDCAITLALLVVLLPAYGVLPGWSALWLPLVVAGMLAASLGVGTMLAALTVKYRDFRYVVPFGVQLWLFATPAIYLGPDPLFGPLGETLLLLNPAQGLVLTFRQSLTGGQVDAAVLAVFLLLSASLFALGCLYFRRVERQFADML
jgi:lipopolysaccharide transport system permease protein